jgi:membrane-associated protease RseP (regulator of RpoE activity)
MLRPTKTKLLIDLIISIVLLALFFLIPAFGFKDILLKSSVSSGAGIILLNFAIMFVLYYPFVCGIMFFCESRKRDKGKGKSPKLKKSGIITAIILILIFNPVSISFIYSGIMAFGHNVINEPCGMKIMNFTENSPAEASGMQVGEIIIGIDSMNISDQDSFIHLLADKKSGDSITIKTESKEYSVKMAENPNTHGAFLGVEVQQAYCRRQ